ncbi:TrbC/VirB2 family protein [Sphingomonas sp.]|uniref:TrbC/VirB2 family protein n=1 Tax=Sphingomonas sp. TaxID=28214 RepID=UPI001B028236|nr:TrbC/VirB2 family protein [Sphingomonas sp.]MBO9711432.1 TrbC/VirB2 family protein [Sphingomonas sp.]
MTVFSASLADPAGSSAIAAAAEWLQGTLLGTLATTIAIVCLASVGLMLLTGRIPLRHGASIVAGCFLIFGATTIAAGIRALSQGESMAAKPLPQEASFRPAAPTAPYDPYAGASLGSN